MYISSGTCLDARLHEGRLHVVTQEDSNNRDLRREGLGDLLFVGLSVVAAAHRLRKSLRIETELPKPLLAHLFRWEAYPYPERPQCVDEKDISDILPSDVTAARVKVLLMFRSFSRCLVNTLRKVTFGMPPAYHCGGQHEGVTPR